MSVYNDADGQALVLGDRYEIVNWNDKSWNGTAGVLTTATNISYFQADFVASKKSPFMVGSQVAMYHYNLRRCDDSASFIPEDWS